MYICINIYRYIDRSTQCDHENINKVNPKPKTPHPKAGDSYRLTGLATTGGAAASKGVWPLNPELCTLNPEP